MGLESKIVTVVLKRDGTLLHTLERCTPEDAARWAEGHHVFQLAAVGKSWAVHYVNDAKVFTDKTTYEQMTPESAQRAASLQLLINKGG